jgi:putative transposase
MTATLPDVAAKRTQGEESAEEQATIELVTQAKEKGLSRTSPGGLLKQLTKMVLETALNEEMTEHLGYEKHDPAGAGSGNIRDGTRPKTVLTEANGPVEIEVPRDRAGTLEPQIVKKPQRRPSGVDEIVLSLYAGMRSATRRRMPSPHERVAVALDALAHTIAPSAACTRYGT